MTLSFGQNAILPIDFLIPTLRVATSLQWKRHEFSNRINELERLDETRRNIVVAMYAEKKRQKHWYD